MRIDAYNAVNQIYQTNAAAKAYGAAKKQSVSDKFEISSEAKTYQTAKAAVSQADDIRADKVARIKAQMEAGTYNISAAAVADKMMNQVTTLTF
ncbi:MAG: flagellar biosynthesis anti-sigma factor FlgM [Eubacteriales bacterium]|nr:flagellar biosynthesis anti-sigma factor FlgM [Eubacteriales bacterium]